MRITKYFDIVQEEGKLCAEEGDSRFHGNDEHEGGSAMTLLNTWLFKESLRGRKGELCGEEGDSRFHGNEEHEEGSVYRGQVCGMNHNHIRRRIRVIAGKERRAVRRRRGFPFSGE